MQERLCCVTRAGMVLCEGKLQQRCGFAVWSTRNSAGKKSTKHSTSSEVGITSETSLDRKSGVPKE